MSEAKPNRLLANKGFWALSVTQFFGAANDYLLKTLLVFSVASQGVWDGLLGKGGQVYPNYSLVLPFLLFCAIAGQLADRHSKRTVTMRVKQAEIGLALLALAGFWLGSVWVCLGAMLMLGIQSAFFSPAKYGLIPELVKPEQLSRANGIINLLTNLAAIVATVVGGYLYTSYVADGEGSPEGRLWLPGVVMLVVAGLGLLAAMRIPKLKAGNPNGPMKWNPFSPLYSTLKEMKTGGTPIFTVVCLWSTFYLIAYSVMLILPDYTSVLNIDQVKVGTHLLGPLGISIGVGSALAGWISGDGIKPRFVAIGAVGLTVSFFLLGNAPPKLEWVTAGIVSVGIFAGFYIVPLQALMQKLSPDESRGRILGAAAAVSAVFELIGIAVFQVCRQVFDLPSQRIFIVVGVIALVATLIFYWKVRAQINRPEWR